MAKPRVWSMDRAMIKGKPVVFRCEYAVKYYHLHCKGQGKNRIVAPFLTGSIARFLVAAANEMEMKK